MKTDSMRDFKVRALDKKTETMRDVVAILYENGSVDAVAYEFGGTGDPYWEYDFILFQSTGLHDKNGKEIYEGDVVQEGGYDSLYLVGFERGHFTLQHTKSSYNKLGIWNIHDRLEVIGNIYENPELLKS